MYDSVFHDKFSEKFGYFWFSEQQIAKLHYLSYQAALLIASLQRDATGISERIVKTKSMLELWVSNMWCYSVLIVTV